MWAIIILVMLLVAGTSFGLVTSRFYKFFYVRKVRERWGEKLGRAVKPVCIALAALPTAAATAVIYVTMGLMNTMIVLIHLMVIWLLCDLVEWLVKRKRGEPFKRYYAGVFALAITAVYLTAAWYLANNVWSTKYIVDTEKQVGELRIVQFADSHVGTTFDGNGFAKWMEKVQAEKPDAVVITGDYVDDDTTREDMVTACAALGRLETTYGVYYAFGNHDKGYYDYRGYSGDDLIAELEKNGVTVLQDESVLLGDRYYLIGRQDRSEEARGESRKTMDELVEGLDPGKYMIVLDHQPHDYDAQAEAGVDLVLSGHTHGGQLFPFNYVGEWTGANAKVYGLEKRQNTNFIVTSGISDWAISFKTGCKSEYVVIDVRGR